MKAFVDTSVLVAGLIDFGPQSAPPFFAALRHGIRVETPVEFLQGLKRK